MERMKNFRLTIILVVLFVGHIYAQEVSHLKRAVPTGG